jgi:hypothetical protein
MAQKIIKEAYFIAHNISKVLQVANDIWYPHAIEIITWTF